MPISDKKVNKSKKRPSLPVSDAVKEYARQTRKYERELRVWHLKRVRLMLVVIAVLDLFVGLGLALTVVALVQLNQEGSAVTPDQPMLLSGLIVLIVFIVLSLGCSAATALWKREIQDQLPRIVGLIVFLGLFGGLTAVNAFLCAYAWFATRKTA